MYLCKWVDHNAPLSSTIFISFLMFTFKISDSHVKDCIWSMYLHLSWSLATNYLYLFVDLRILTLSCQISSLASVSLFLTRPLNIKYFGRVDATGVSIVSLKSFFNMFSFGVRSQEHYGWRKRTTILDFSFDWLIHIE